MVMEFTRRIHKSGKYSVLSLPASITQKWREEGASHVLYGYDEETNAITILPYEE